MLDLQFPSNKSSIAHHECPAASGQSAPVRAWRTRLCKRFWQPRAQGCHLGGGRRHRAATESADEGAGGRRHIFTGCRSSSLTSVEQSCFSAAIGFCQNNVMSSPAYTRRICFFACRQRGRYITSYACAPEHMAWVRQMNPYITSLALYDVVGTPGVAADVSHINSKAQVKVRHGRQCSPHPKGKPPSRQLQAAYICRCLFATKHACSNAGTGCCECNLLSSNSPYGEGFA